MQNKSVERIYHGKRFLIRSLGWQRYVAARLLNTSGATTKNHYEVLELERDCSPNAIRQSFIRLSKEVHPDKNPDSTDVHQKFILINEAYSVLSKPHMRHIYDADLIYHEKYKTRNYSGIVTNAPRDRVIFQDNSFWETRDRSEDKKYEGRSYYGVSGIKKKLPNTFIAFGAVIFMIVGGLFHFFIAKTSSAFSMEQLDKRDRMASLTHRVARQQALANGNELQMTLLQEKINASQKQSQSSGKEDHREVPRE